ncbi:OmpH family outer membrane protein [Salidesulfovibrio onnuriiensis]|uniref:OmpH family outer membrane protein n=1 Tax=Salidesulfovibrio onnuriiensis TaxID=2583823 RepID=UPI00202B9E92|nr:OmpH family outer membrane protein [Salidesulfovibrio onnuriiensis]
MKQIKIVVSAMCLLALLAPQAFARVGFINPQRVVNESRIGKVAQEDLAKLGRIKDQRIRKSGAKIDGIKAEIGKGGLSVTDQKVRENQLEVLYGRHERLIKQSNQDIRSEESLLIQFIMRKADKILRRLAAQDGFTLILTDPDSIGYISPEVDLTDRVIKALNEEM